MQTLLGGLRLSTINKESPNNTVSISIIPGLIQVFFPTKIARISPFNAFNTVFIKKTHFLPPETRIKEHFFVTLNENIYIDYLKKC